MRIAFNFKHTIVARFAELVEGKLSCLFEEKNVENIKQCFIIDKQLF